MKFHFLENLENLNFFLQKIYVDDFSKFIFQYLWKRIHTQLDPFYSKSPPELACNLIRDAELFPSVQLKDIRF